MASTLIYEHVIERIKSMIIDGVYKPGDKLPTIKQLSAEFGVGESSVREAIRILENLKILYVRQGSGVYVSKDPSIEATPFFRFQELESQSITYLCEVRRLIEPRIAMLAAVKAKDEDVKIIKKLAYELNNKIHSSRDDWLEADLLFHQKIASSAHNPYLTKMIDTLEAELKDSRRTTSKIQGSLERAANFHILIAEAIANRNPSQAGLLMLAHTDDLILDLKKQGCIELSFVFDHLFH